MDRTKHGIAGERPAVPFFLRLTGATAALAPAAHATCSGPVAVQALGSGGPVSDGFD